MCPAQVWVLDVHVWADARFLSSVKNTNEGINMFDGTTWQRMDPTFASTGNKDSSIMEFIGDGTNYTEKYLY